MLFYQNCRTMEELKAEYKRLAKMYHPDLAENEADAQQREKIMAQVNAQYDERAKILPNTNAAGETYQPRDREAPEAFRAAVLAAMKMQGVTVELCGLWLWVTGDTFSNRDALKAAGYRFSSNKRAWYWHQGSYKKRGSDFSLDDIRYKFGSVTVTAGTAGTAGRLAELTA